MRKYIYTGEFLQNPDKFGRQFLQECMLALIEYMHLQKENDLVFVPIKFLEMLGDSSSLTKKMVKKGNQIQFGTYGTP